MKILVIGDLHGLTPRIHFKNFDAIIMTGDIASDKDFRPFYNEWFSAIKKGEDFEDVDTFILKKVGRKGLKKLENKSLEVGNKILKRLDKFGKPIFFVPGNWDQSYGKTKIKDMNKSDFHYRKAFMDFFMGDKTNSRISKGIKNFKDTPFHLHEFMGVNIIGYGLSSAPEDFVGKSSRKIGFNKKEKVALNKLYKKLERKLFHSYEKRNKNLPTIFLTHNVPYNTKLDKIVNKDSPGNGKHVGSFLARRFINRFKPLICIGGHVHEHFGKDKIGRTTVINAGFGRDASVLIDVDEKKGKIKKIEFYKKYKFKHKH